jgi:hypothetical protein
MTINFTPQLYREHYRIYSKDRFIVTLNHAINTAKMANLAANPGVKFRTEAPDCESLTNNS